MKEKCWCGKSKGHSEKEFAKGIANIIKIAKDSIVEYDKPKDNGEIGTILGIGVFIKK